MFHLPTPQYVEIRIFSENETDKGMYLVKKLKDYEVIRKMKTAKNIWSKIIADENIRTAFYRAAKKKKNRKDVKEVLDNIEKHVEIVKKILTETTPYDKTKGYLPRTHSRETINESSNKKVRVIDKPKYKYDQVIHHAIMQQLIPFMSNGMYKYVCGSIPKRGTHSAKKAIEKWLRNDQRNTKYVLKMDIRHFYESVDHDVLKAYLKSRIKDEYVLNILFIIIDQVEKGLPLGFYTSQWLANFMLQPLDHFIKHELHAKYYVRYLDDMVVFGSNKKTLRNMRDEIKMYLENKLHLQMKNNHQVFRFEYYSKKKGKVVGRPLDFLGFEFHRDRTVLRKSIMLSVTRKAKRISKKKKKTHYDASSMLSYMGYVTNTQTYGMYLKRIKPYAKVKEMKKIVSRHARKERKNELQKSGKFADGKTY